MSDHHPRKDLETVRNYVAEVVPLLRMQNWDIYIDPEVLTTKPDNPDDKDIVWAATKQDRNHWSGVIQFSREFFTDASPAMRRHFVVHELVHFQHRDVYEVWNDCIPGNDVISQADANAYTCDFQMHMERFVSWVTHQLEHVAPAWPGAQKVPKGGVFISGEWTGI